MPSSLVYQPLVKHNLTLTWVCVLLLQLQDICYDKAESKRYQTISESSAENSYWEPAESVNELYKQLNSKKYREIVRQRVK